MQSSRTPARPYPDDGFDPQTPQSRRRHAPAAGSDGPGTRRSRPRLPTDVPPSEAVSSHDAHLLRLCVALELDALMLTLGAAASDPDCPPPPAFAAPNDHARTPDTPAARTGEPQLHGVVRPSPGPHAADHGGHSANGGHDGHVVAPSPAAPWQRWLREDVAATQALARELLDWGGELPASMGRAGSPTATMAVLNRLEAFHREVRDLLREVEEANRTGRTRDPGPTPGTAPPIGTAATAPNSTGTAARTDTDTGTGTGTAGDRARRLAAVVRHCRRRLAELDLLRLELTASRPVPDPFTVTFAGGVLPGEFLG